MRSNIILFVVLCLVQLQLKAQVQLDSVVTASTVLRIGVREQPPFLMQDEQGQWSGLALALWERVSDDINSPYDLIDLDVEPTTSVDIELLAVYDPQIDAPFSQVYFSDQIAIAQPDSVNLLAIAKAFFSPKFWRIVLALSALLLVIGLLVYFVERKQNEEAFGGERNTAQGIGAGFWWAGVTMTTIGYGDKAPVTFVGRSIAMLWMLAAMAITASLTASIVSVMDAGQPKDVSLTKELNKKQVLCAQGSPTASFLRTQGIQFEEVADLSKSLEQVASGQTDLAISSRATLRYLVSENKDLKLKVQPKPHDIRLYGMILHQKDHKKQIDQAILNVLRSPFWLKEQKRWGL